MLQSYANPLQSTPTILGTACLVCTAGRAPQDRAVLPGGIVVLLTWFVAFTGLVCPSCIMATL